MLRLPSGSRRLQQQVRRLEYGGDDHDSCSFRRLLIRFGCRLGRPCHWKGRRGPPRDHPHQYGSDRAVRFRGLHDLHRPDRQDLRELLHRPSGYLHPCTRSDPRRSLRRHRGDGPLPGEQVQPVLDLEERSRRRGRREHDRRRSTDDDLEERRRSRREPLRVMTRPATPRNDRGNLIVSKP